MATTILWICCGLLAYVYVLYPRLVATLAKRYGVQVNRGTTLPSVTLIVTAYNEQECIGQNSITSQAWITHRGL